jgi:hypothetical protein
MALTANQKRALLGMGPIPSGTIDTVDRHVWLGLTNFSEEVEPPTPPVDGINEGPMTCTWGMKAPKVTWEMR